MKSILNGYFFNPTKGQMTIEGVIEELANYISEKPEKFYDIVVGCDSSSSEEPTFPLAIVILRAGEGGRFFLQRVSYKGRKFYSWKQRILEEVFLSCQLALHLRENFDAEIKIKTAAQNKPFNYQFRYIHADVGEKGQTKDMVKEVTGLIRGNGFEPKIKPESYAASVVADRFS